MSKHQWDVQVAVGQKLQAANIMAVRDGGVSRPVQIFDDVPEDATMPYIVLGDDVATDDSDDLDTAEVHIVTFHCFSAERSRQEVKLMLKSIYQALNRSDINLPEGQAVDIQFVQSATAIENEDGLTRTGSISFRVHIKNAED